MDQRKKSLLAGLVGAVARGAAVGVDAYGRELTAREAAAAAAPAPKRGKKGKKGARRRKKADAAPAQRESNCTPCQAMARRQAAAAQVAGIMGGGG